MSLLFYKFLHVFTMLAATTVVGALIAGASGGFRRGLVAVHGTAMLVLLVAGFGALAKLGVNGLPGWVIAKVLIWVIIGAIIVPARKMPALKGVWIGVTVVLSAAATWLALYKPF